MLRWTLKEIGLHLYGMHLFGSGWADVAGSCEKVL